jgi:4-aminobutyrate aminotransferase-like enzyme
MNKPLMINAFDPSNAEGLTPEMRTLLERRQRVLGPSYKLFYEEPVHLVRAEGVWMFDPQGNRYLDTYNNVPSVGHCHPRVVEAISKQVAILNTHTRYLHDLILDYAEKLIATFPEELSSVMFTCTGSEAVDLALRVARYATGGAGIIITGNAYHGITSAVSEISPSLGEHVPLGLNVRTVPPPDLRQADGSDVGRTFAKDVQAAVDDLQRRGVKVAALIVDTIFSSDGVFADPAGFLAPAVEVVRRAGGLFIADEVQPGFGRTGDAMWGFQRHGIVPDMVVIGKPMGNGQPIAAMIARPEVVQNFGQRSRYFNTFGGNPVSCAAALAVLEIIEEEKLIQNAKSVGSYLKSGLEDLAQKYKAMGQVRGAGLFIGVDLVDQYTDLADPDLAIRVVNGLRRRFVLISASGPDGHVLKIRPPLPFSRENADQFLTALKDTLHEETAKK